LPRDADRRGPVRQTVELVNAFTVGETV